jgi:hypothetical protein
MRKGSVVSGLTTTNRLLYGLIFLAMFLSLGYHIDHVVRGKHIGWLLTEHVTPFTYSLVLYPFIVLGLYLYASGRVDPGSVPRLSNPRPTSLTSTSRGSSVGCPLGGLSSLLGC